MKYKEIPEINNCLEIGYISRPHGKDGEVLLSIKNVDYEDIQDLPYLFLCRQERLVPFFIEKATIKSNSFFVKFEDINTLEKAEQYCGTKVYIESDEEQDDDIQDNDLVGFSVIDFDTKATIGTIQEVIAYSLNVVFDVKKGDGSSVLIPFAEDLLKEINEELRTITLEIPDGILEA